VTKSITTKKPKQPDSVPNGVLILECLDTKKGDPGSEGRFLVHMLNLMEVQNQYVEIRTKQQFSAMLGVNPFDVVHITTHGALKDQQFRGFWTPKGTVRLDDFDDGALDAKVVVATACGAGQLDFKNEFIKKVSCKYYIAPDGTPIFHNAIFFAHWFYHNLFVLKRSPPEIVTRYNDNYKNPH
jgi:hypothetical protein